MLTLVEFAWTGTRHLHRNGSPWVAIALALFAGHGASQATSTTVYDNFDPLAQGCSLGFAQSAMVGTSFYVIGGMMTYTSENGSQHKGPNMPMRILDTSKSFTIGNTDELPITFDERPEENPEFSGGSLWAWNQSLWQHPGYSETSDTKWPGWNVWPSNATDEFWQYNIAEEYWLGPRANQQTIMGEPVHRVRHGLSTVIDSKAYLFGGEIDNDGSFAQGMMVYDFTQQTWENRTTPRWRRWASGLALHVPVADPQAGYLFGLAGRSRDNNELSRIDMYDLKDETWLEAQEATGAERFGIPLPRQNACAVIARATDGTSYNIYVFGGQSLSSSEVFKDLWVLSIPSFRWFLASTGGSYGPEGLQSMSCALVGGGRKMLVYGGLPLENSGACDRSGTYVFDLTTLQWDSVYEPNAGEYKIPKVIYDVIGGGPEGGATLLPEMGFTNLDMEAEFKKVIKKAQDSLVNGTSTSVDSGSGSSSPTGTLVASTQPNSSLQAGAKAGIAVGVVGGVILLAVGLLWLRKRGHGRNNAGHIVYPTELANQPDPRELPYNGPYASNAQELNSYMPSELGAGHGRGSMTYSQPRKPVPEQPSPPLGAREHEDMKVQVMGGTKAF